MLTLHLQGGLGNQMFQYAASRALALRQGRQLGLDATTGFESDPYGRRYLLDNFAVSAPVLTPERAKQAADNVWFRTRACRELEGFCKNHLRRGYVPPLLGLMSTGSGYLDGYWQSEKYFSDSAASVRTEFTCVRALCDTDRSLSENILGTESVSIHVRRGRYPVLCPAIYYSKAVELLCQRVAKPSFFVFGDDKVWISNLIANLGKRLHCIVATSAGDDVDDFQLMRACKHHIIANSSFSWWAAWLSEAPGSIVVAPKAGWTGNGQIVADSLPTRWIALPTAVEFGVRCQV